MLEHYAACENVVVLTRDHFVAYLSAGDPSLMQIKAPRGYPSCEVAASMHVLLTTVGACKSQIKIGKTATRKGGRMHAFGAFYSKAVWRHPIKVIDAVGIGSVGPVGRSARGIARGCVEPAAV
jgi:hypothetical protein